jgi:hypothetical protein
MEQFEIYLGSTPAVGRRFSRPRENIFAHGFGSSLHVGHALGSSARGRAEQQPGAAVLPILKLSGHQRFSVQFIPVAQHPTLNIEFGFRTRRRQVLPVEVRAAHQRQDAAHSRQIAAT